MKKTLYPILSVLGLVLVCFFTSCAEKEPCELVSCAYGGICDEGACICQVGYEGVLCETVARDKFIVNGIYQVNENGTLSEIAQYNTNIIEGPNVNEILLQNVRGNLFDGYDVLATVIQDTMFVAPQNTGNGYQIEGKGIITDKQEVGRHYYQDAIIDFTYKVTNLTSMAVDEYGTNGSQPSNWNKN